MSTKNIWFTRDTIVSIMSSVSSILSTCVNFFDIFVLPVKMSLSQTERAVQRQKRCRPRAPSLVGCLQWKPRLKKHLYLDIRYIYMANWLSSLKISFCFHFQSILKPNHSTQGSIVPRVTKSENFPDSKIFVAKTFRIKRVNFQIHDKCA